MLRPLIYCIVKLLLYLYIADSYADGGYENADGGYENQQENVRDVKDEIYEYPDIYEPVGESGETQSPTSTLSAYQLDRSTIVLDKNIGAGHFAEVWKGTWNNTTPVAVKILKDGRMSLESFLAEADIMEKCQHENILRFYGVCVDTEPIYIVSELMSKGNLLDFLRSTKFQPLQFRSIVDMATQIASGMSYLEQKQIVHTDLAARNILVDDNDKLKIGDFGWATTLQDNLFVPKKGFRYPVKWTAPEATTKCNFSIKSDVWSFGIVLMEIMTQGRIPYPGMSNNKVMARIKIGYRQEMPITCPKPMYDIMLKCWNKKPEERPTFEWLFYFLDDYFVSSETMRQAL